MVSSRSKLFSANFLLMLFFCLVLFAQVANEFFHITADIVWHVGWRFHIRIDQYIWCDCVFAIRLDCGTGGRFEWCADCFGDSWGGSGERTVGRWHL